jgi:hypothetical protein
MSLKKKSKAAPKRPRKPAPKALSASTAVPQDFLPIPPAKPEPEWLSLFLLALFWGCYGFSWILSRELPGPPGAKSDYAIYLSSWALVPALSLAVAYLIHWLKVHIFPHNASWYPLLIASNVAVWSFQWYRMPDPISPEYLGGILTWVPWVNAAGACLASLPGLARWEGWRRLEGKLLLLVPVAVLVGLKHFDSGAFPPQSRWAAMVALAGCATWLVSRQVPGQGSKSAWWLGLGALWLLLLLQCSLDLPHLTDTLKHHQNFYLGPVNDVLHGKSMLVDVNCQYGVGVIYFLALLFKTHILGLYYPQLTFLIMCLWMAQYVWLFKMLRKIFQSPWLLVFCMASATLLERFGYFTDDNIAAPSVGPLRFGLPLLVLTAAYARRVKAEGAGASRRLELALLGIASIWSFETFAYSMAGYGAVLFHESWADSIGLRGFVGRFIPALLKTALALAAAQVLFGLGTLLRSGHWPAWSQYLEYVSLYGRSRFGSLEFPVFSPWIALAGLSFLSVMAASFGLFSRRDCGPSSMFVFGLSAAGILEFTYFLGRSHPDNISHTCFNTVVASFYWLDRCWTKACVQRGFKLAATFGALLLASTFGFAFAENCQLRFSQSLLGNAPRMAGEFLSGEHPSLLQKYLARLRSTESDSGQIAGIAALVDKYCPNDSRVSLFIAPAITTEALLCSGRSHVFPISNPEEDSLLASNVARAVACVANLKPGAILFISGDESLGGPDIAGNNIGASVLLEIRKRFQLELVENSPIGIRVMRLAPLA